MIKLLIIVLAVTTARADILLGGSFSISGNMSTVVNLPDPVPDWLKFTWTRDDVVGIQGGIPVFPSPMVSNVVTHGGDASGTFDNSSVISNIINLAPSTNDLVLFFPTNSGYSWGRYKITNGVTYRRSRVIFRGEGDDVKIFTDGATPQGFMFNFAPDGATSASSNSVWDVVGIPQQGATNITLATATNTAGQFLGPNRFYALTDATRDYSTEDFPRIDIFDNDRLILLTVASHSVVGLTNLNLKRPLDWSFTNQPKLYTFIGPFNVLSNIGFENIKLSTTNDLGVSGAVPTDVGIQMECVYEPWLSNVVVEYFDSPIQSGPGKYGIQFRQVVGYHFTKLTVRGYLSGVGSKAGFREVNSSYGLIEDSIFFDIYPGIEPNNSRACVIFMSFFTNNSAQGVLYHNAHDMRNLVEHCDMEGFQWDGNTGSRSHNLLFRTAVAWDDHFQGVEIRRWSYHNGVVGCVIGNTNYNFTYYTADAGNYSMCICDGHPNIGNLAFTDTAPPRSPQFPGTNYLYGGFSRPNGWLFTTAQGPDTTFTNDFANLNAAGGVVSGTYALRIQRASDTNDYYSRWEEMPRPNGLNIVSSTTTSITVNATTSIDAGDILYIGGQTAFQQRDLNFDRNVITGNGVITNQNPIMGVAWNPVIPATNLASSYFGRPPWLASTNPWPMIGPDVPGGRLTIPAKQRYYNTYPTWDPDALAYYNRILNLGSDMPVAQQTAVNNFMTSVRAYGYLSKIKDASPMFGTNYLAGAVKLIRFAGTEWTNAITGFGAAHFTTDGGFIGGTGRRLGTGVEMDDIGVNGGLAVFLLERNFIPDSTARQALGGALSTAPYCNITWNGAAGLWCGWGDVLQSFANRPMSYGLYRANSRATNSHQLLLNDVTLAASTANSSGVTNRAITVFAQPSGTSVFDKKLGWYSIDDGSLTDAEAAHFADAVLTMMIESGRIVPETNTMNFVFGEGQSLSVGANGNPPLTTTAFTNNNAIPTHSIESQLYVATNGFGNFRRPTGFTVENSMIGYGNMLNIYSGGTESVGMINVGVSGAAYALLAKGTAHYTAFTNYAVVAKRRSRGYYTGFKIVNVLLRHGEADFDETIYDDMLTEWQSDLQDDFQSITGQTNIIPFLMIQPTSWCKLGAGANSFSPFRMYEKWEEEPTKFILVGSDYFTPHGDGTHLTNIYYRKDGQYFAKVDYTNRVLGLTWQPLAFTNQVRSNNVLWLRYPTGVDLVADTTTVTDPGNLGFEITDDSAATISSVALVIADGAGITNCVMITMSGTPTTNRRIRYAFTGIPGNNAGPTTGPRGCIKRPDVVWSAASPWGDNLDDWHVLVDKVMN